MKHKKIFNIMLYTNFFSINRKNSFGYNKNTYILLLLFIFSKKSQYQRKLNISALLVLIAHSLTRSILRYLCATGVVNVR